MIVFNPLTISEAIAILTSLATIIVVVISIYPLNKSLQSSCYEASREQALAADRLFIKYPELRKYFYSGVDIDENDPNYERALSIAEYMLDFVDSTLIQRERFGHVWPKSWWLPYFRELFATSPILCHFLESHKNWYREELTELMKQGKQLRQNGSTQPNQVVSFPFPPSPTSGSSAAEQVECPKSETEKCFM